MFQTKKAHTCKLYVETKKGAVKRFGHVRNVVFHPSKPQAVGLTIKRPDFLLMIKRKDRFVALDRTQPLEGGDLLANLEEKDAWDGDACKRLGIDFDACIIWDNMSVRNAEGHEFGAISNINLDDDLRISSIEVSTSATERAILGAIEVDASKLKGYDPGTQAIIVDLNPDEAEVSGGVAGKAGEAWATGKHRVNASQQEISDRAAENIEATAVAAGEAIGSIRDKVKEAGVGEKASQLGEKAGNAINEGAFKLGQAIGNLRADEGEALADGAPADETSASAKDAKAPAPAKEPKNEADENTAYDAAARKVGEQLRKTKGMFSAFKEEFDKASK